MANVQVILKEKIANLGAEADIVSVKAGYARNYLVPQGKAYAATAGNVPDRVIDPSGRDLPRVLRRPIRPRRATPAQPLRAGRLSMASDRGPHAIASKPMNVGPAATMARMMPSPITVAARTSPPSPWLIAGLSIARKA